MHSALLSVLALAGATSALPAQPQALYPRASGVQFGMRYKLESDWRASKGADSRLQLE